MESSIGAVVAYDTRTGGTARLACRVAAGLGCAAVPLAELADGAMDRVGLLVLGGPVHGDAPSDPVKKFLARAAPLPPRVAVFCVHAANEDFAHSYEDCLGAMRAAVEARGSAVAGSFHARGENSDPGVLQWLRDHMPERLEGALSSKGHPDAAELDAAEAWGRELAVGGR